VKLNPFHVNTLRAAGKVMFVWRNVSFDQFYFNDKDACESPAKQTAKHPSRNTAISVGETETAPDLRVLASSHSLYEGQQSIDSHVSSTD